MGDSKPIEKGQMSRKKFVRLAALGAAGAFAVTVFQSGLPGIRSVRRIKTKRVVGNGLHGEGSIFQPKNPPRV